MKMRKLLMMALWAVCLTAGAATNNDDDDNSSRDALSLSKSKGGGKWAMHVGLGVSLPTDVPDGLNFSAFRSWEIQWTVAQYQYTPNEARQTYSAGIGVNWRNYGLKNNGNMFYKDRGVVEVGSFPEGVGSRYSGIHTLAVNVPLLFRQKIARNFDFSVGAIVNFNVYGSISNSYESDDDHYRVTIKNVGQRPVTVDLIGIAHYHGVGVYCKYSPMNVLKKDRGPQFSSVSFGLYL